MDINKRFSDLGSIVKTLLRHIDMRRAYIKIGLDNMHPNEVCVGLFRYDQILPVVYYTWVPGKVQSIRIPDELCMEHVLQKKVRVKSLFSQAPRRY